MLNEYVFVAQYGASTVDTVMLDVSQWLQKKLHPSIFHTKHPTGLWALTGSGGE